jgi:hypothetical protein
MTASDFLLEGNSMSYCLRGRLKLRIKNNIKFANIGISYYYCDCRFYNE